MSWVYNLYAENLAIATAKSLEDAPCETFAQVSEAGADFGWVGANVLFDPPRNGLFFFYFFCFLFFPSYLT